MKRQDWLSLVSVHSDSWLLAVAFFNGARLDAEGRRQLFNDINSLPTSYEIISGRAVANKPPGGGVQLGKRAAAGGSYPDGDAGGREVKRGRAGAARRFAEPDDEAEEAEDDEGGANGGDGGEPCPNCGRLYRNGEFWIACDACDRWFDGKCQNMTAAKAERNPTWTCPFCAAVAPPM
jgi:hypothetical protein